MLKMFRRILICGIAASLVCNGGMCKVHAEERNDESYQTITKDEFVEKNLEKMITDSLRTEEYYYYAVLVGSAITDWSSYSRVLGQDSGGTVFSSLNDGIYWQDSGGTTGYWNTTVTINASLVSVTIGVEGGRVAPTAVGYFASATSTSMALVLWVRRKYKVKQYNVYRYLVTQTPDQAVLFSTYTQTEKYTHQATFFANGVTPN